MGKSLLFISNTFAPCYSYIILDPIDNPSIYNMSRCSQYGEIPTFYFLHIFCVGICNMIITLFLYSLIFFHIITFLQKHWEEDKKISQEPVKRGVNPAFLKFIDRCNFWIFIVTFYSSIRFWKGNESKNPFLVSNFTKNADILRKPQKNHFFGLFFLTN